MDESGVCVCVWGGGVFKTTTSEDVAITTLTLESVRSSLETQLTCPEPQILDSSKLKEFADDNFILYENGRKLSKWDRKHCGKSNFSFCHSVF